jgi:hypothetical protein
VGLIRLIFGVLTGLATQRSSRSVPRRPGLVGRSGHSLSILESKIYLFGGVTNLAKPDFRNDLATLNCDNLLLPSNQWEMVFEKSDNREAIRRETPAPRAWHSMVTFNYKLYL